MRDNHRLEQQGSSDAKAMINEENVFGKTTDNKVHDADGSENTMQRKC